MDFRVLGPVTAHDGETEVELGGPKQRLVLATLLAAHGATVSTAALIGALWLETPPATARKTIQGYVHHLRSRIGEGLHTDHSGYSMLLGEEQVDERRFGAAVAAARSMIESDPGTASEWLADALALWRGNPYADLDDALVLQAEITRLTEARLVALADRLDADLRLARHDLVIGELESLCVECPLRERFRAQLMLALYRSGRHGEALRVYARTRDLFVEELGIEPSAQLSTLEEQILARDPELELRVDDAVPGATRGVRGYELREALVTDERGTLYRGYQRSVGREVAIRVCSATYANDPRFISDFDADVARISALDHPNIVYVEDSWREPGRVYQVMQWIAGERLGALLARQRPSPSVALRMLDQIAGALGAAHRGGVVHGNIGPSSVLVIGSGDAYLTDFVLGRPAGRESDDRVALACLAHLMLSGEAPPDDDSGSGPRPSHELSREVRELFQAAFADQGLQSPEDLIASLRQAVDVDSADPVVPAPSESSDLRCPYKGLHTFQAVDAGDFFGRDELVDRLLGLVTRRRLVAVVGPSGSGKSSLVRAGLLPRLVQGSHPPLIAQMYPGPYPFDALAEALWAIAVRDHPIDDRLRRDDRGLHCALEGVLPTGSTELVLVIDQLEELFVMVDTESLRSRFLDSLATAVTDPASRLRLVVVLRAEYFDRPLRYARFGALVDAGLVAVPMLGDAGVTAAIEGPATAAGLRVEQGLTAEIVRDLAAAPGGLARLQYALTELFERRTGNELTLEGYRIAGGVHGAVFTRAESIYQDLDARSRTAVRRAFLQLISVDERATSVRRWVARPDLDALDSEGLGDALERFAQHRLLIFETDPVSRAPTVEVAHETLLHEWDRLRDWIEAERHQLARRRERAAGARQEAALAHQPC